MSVATTTERSAETGAQSWLLAGARDLRWLVCALTAAVLLVAAAFSPLWTMRLEAPQYPAGLELVAYGNRMEGDLGEINELNHYIGIRAIEPDSVTELALFVPVMTALVLVVVAGAFVVRGWRLRALLAAAVWSIPLGMLADMQWWLYSYGHDINPDAPLRIKEFTPRVLGSTKVMNFHSEAMVSTGFWLMVAAALLLSAGPWLSRFLWESWNTTDAEGPK